MGTYTLEICYLIASICYIVGLKMMAGPKTARNGNLLAAGGMTLAIFATIFLYQYEIDNESKNLGNYIWVFGGIIVGTIAGWLAAKKVQMTAMPQMVSLFNGMGGACAALIALVEFPDALEHMHEHWDVLFMSTILCGLVIGSTSFSGSMIAYLKLNGNLKKDIRLPFYNIINTILIVGIIGLTICLAGGHIPDVNEFTFWAWILLAGATIYGIMFVLPIGGADMPVVISLLNSFTGMAAMFGGFLYDNMAMLTGGILVGSAGTILTVVMCRAMNRSLSNVIFGAFGTGGSATAATSSGEQKSYKETNSSDLAVLLNYSSKVIIVPGYGLAVAQAQHVVNEMEQILNDRGVEVKYAIHPVAGRMPGHMNVLLAESNVEYEKLVEMDDINPEFSTCDVVIVLGANDVVNPAAKEDPSSPIYGMPILNVEDAKTTIVNKRSMNVGYAGIDNDLFYRDKTNMLFGDAKKVLTEIVGELKNL
ncbi:MAG: NAD(P) transhydrogenase subunit beta [Crocinitomicaceae bacterium]|jgi:NAD(P) transhydrogenase subunit beta|nr:NAD(P) transhydrogenase subunit beta [Crocinitomicaceae bacterium]MEC9158957.1 NAD(P)(+) transhydrogenase (Re/Si-specific) subunit beta [Bacteroidota bacterium]|tara:strand:+ start:132 stop:1565 length:1434 start_codon:yes stop_codon:yes gene_type:complete